MQRVAEAWLEYLQANGCRLTESRRTVVEIIAGSSKVLTPLDVFEEARTGHPGIGLVTVYRTLEKLEDLGLIQRVHQPSGCQAFTAALTGHQHLLICQRCGQVRHFSGDHLDGLVGNVEAESGFHVDEHWLQLFGLCPDCKD
jgi:Fe2+ or Zn2+ uptake regulation protein